MDIGIFLPIGNNGWLISTTSPQFKPSFDLNREVALKAEKYGFEFALSMIKLRGFGGPSEYWDHNLESFTLMAGLAAVTTRIKLFASVALITLPPAFTARMATTIDSIAKGRFGVNIVTGWQKAEYVQMGTWPGDDYFAHRYQYAAEYVTVMRELWADARSDFKGKFFQMEDCRMSPKPKGRMPIIAAGQSNTGMEFAANHCEYNFLSGSGINEPETLIPHVERLNAAVAKSGRDCGALALCMIIADETDELAMAKWEHYKQGTDHVALAWQASQAATDVNAEAHSTAGRMTRREPLPTHMQRYIGSYATVAKMLDQVATIPGLKGVMLTFDDFLVGMDQFGQRIQPLMKSRTRLRAA